MKTLLKIIPAVLAFGLLMGLFAAFRADDKAVADQAAPRGLEVVIKVNKCKVQIFTLTAFVQRDWTEKYICPAVNQYDYEWYRNNKFYSRNRVLNCVPPAKYTVIVTNKRTRGKGTATFDLLRADETFLPNTVKF